MIVMRHGLRLDGLFMDQVQGILNWNRPPDNLLLNQEQIERLRRASNGNQGEVIAQIALEIGIDRINSPLAPTERQNYVRDSVQEMIRLGQIPEVIITSPYRRTVETAHIAQQLFVQAGHRQIPIQVDDRIQEWPYAAFGRFGEPITPITPHIPLEPFEFDWDNSVLHLELEADSERNHVARIRWVLGELARQLPRVLVIGHQHTVGAAFQDLMDFAQVQSGGYVQIDFPTESAWEINPNASRGLHFH